ncbi:MAG: TetR/AcrR family transcriptional regulator [Proteobacteria bacterium]|nr:TetR/AcrR family transcriptional regulator [Pseudomonadota bacterium]
MSSEPHTAADENADGRQTRRRLSRNDRQRQLLDTAWSLVRREGTDSLSLGRLSEEAGVTKPVVYDHFGTRAGLLAALYREYDARQTALMDEALAKAPRELVARAGVIAACYLDCVLTQGREIAGVSAALAGSPELEQLKRGYNAAFIAKCRATFQPFAATPVPAAAFWGVLGAAEALSGAAAAGDLTREEAQTELHDIIVAAVQRHAATGQ